MVNPMFMSAAQLVAFTQMLAIQQGGVGRGADNRLIQPLNNRTIGTSVMPPPPLAVSGSLGFTTTLANAAAFEAQEPAFIAVLAAQLAVPVSAISIVSYTDVADSSPPLSDIMVTFSVSAPTAGAAATLSGMIAAATSVPFGGAMSTLVAALKTGAAGLGIMSVMPAPPVAVQSTDPIATISSLSANLATLSDEVDALSATVTALTATVTSLQVTMAALPTAASLSAALPTAASVAALATTVGTLSTLQTTTSNAIAALTTAVDAL